MWIYILYMTDLENCRDAHVMGYYRTKPQAEAAIQRTIESMLGGDDVATVESDYFITTQYVE